MDDKIALRPDTYSLRGSNDEESLVFDVNGRPFRIVTIVTVQSLPKLSRETGRVLGTFHQPSGRTIRSLFVRIAESGRVSGRGFKLYFNKVLAFWNVLN